LKTQLNTNCEGIATPLKVLLDPYRRKQMAVNPNPDRDVNYMKQMWGTTKLVTDYFPIKTQKTRKYRIDYCEYFEDVAN
jgi:hypothetical protein